MYNVRRVHITSIGVFTLLKDMTSRLWSCDQRKRAILTHGKYVYTVRGDGHLYYIGLRTSSTRKFKFPY